VNLGYASPEDLDDGWRLVRAGGLPAPRPNAAVNTLYDPTDAPPGCYTGLLRQFAPYALADGGEGEWDSVAGWYGRRCVEAWRHYAPNLTEDAILDWVPYTPLEIARKMVNMVRGDWMMGESQPREHARPASVARARPVPHADRPPVPGGFDAAPARVHARSDPRTTRCR